MKYWVLTSGAAIMAVMTGEFTQDQLPNGFQIETDLPQETIIRECGIYDGKLVHVGAKPTAMHKLDDVKPQWIIDTALVEQYKENLKSKIDDIRKQKSTEPIEFYNSVFDANEVSIQNLNAWQLQLMAGVSLPDGFVWRDHYNNDHLVDATFINGLAAAITLRGTSLYTIAWAKKAEVDQLSFDDLLTYDPEINW